MKKNKDLLQIIPLIEEVPELLNIDSIINRFVTELRNKIMITIQSGIRYDQPREKLTKLVEILKDELPPVILGTGRGLKEMGSIRGSLG